jgi:membrane fusion protein, multidrug efflux system
VRPTHAVLMIALLAGCNKAESAGEGGGGGPGGGGPPAMPVEAATARADTVVDAIISTGQIEAMQSIELRPDVEGRLVQILVREGSLVRQGTPLFKIDDAELKAQVAQIEAERDLARQSLTRTRELLQQKASSQAELERAEATMRSNEAQLDRLKTRLNRTLVRAPFSGIVGQRYVSLGDYVTSDTRLAALQTVSPQRASFQVPERYAEQLEPGQSVTFRVAALPGREFTGTVDFVDPIVQLPGRTIMVKARVPNPRRELQAGMFIEARLATAVRPNAVVIPEDAVLPLQGSNFVWVVTDGKAARRQVELGVRTPGFVEVKSGVESAEQVVVGGQERLAEGAPVQATMVERRPFGGREETAAVDTARTRPDTTKAANSAESTGRPTDSGSAGNSAKGQGDR